MSKTPPNIPKVKLVRDPETGDLIPEVWKKVAEFEVYQVSNYGRIKSPTQLLNPSVSRKGYHRINLRHEGRRKAFSVHRLVAAAFIKNPLRLPQINHIDTVKTNNKVRNLEWCTASHNIQHAFRLGLNHGPSGEACGNSKLTESAVKEIRKALVNGVSQSVLAKRFGVAQPNISQIQNRVTWKHI